MPNQSVTPHAHMMFSCIFRAKGWAGVSLWRLLCGDYHRGRPPKAEKSILSLEAPTGVLLFCALFMRSCCGPVASGSHLVTFDDCSSLLER